MGFHVGQLVVCVNADPNFDPGGSGGLDGLARRRVYTIREAYYDEEAYALVVRLLEIPHRRDDWPYFASRFRPVREQSIEVFRRIAASPKERIRIGEDA